ncbi:MAG: fused MFS/spermidine synthase [Methylovulum sp.]|uniref:spermidine synthase n=1 Tax=Methylovulum sp. TaxID=1916980 RepID=UPI00262D8CCE|nr:fused MFS/spermidine synthase [Methylovulum sp.]MDD2723827.1 fused MFS/spermidine synthase [Methylovulum sp.]MDD5123705.1 fused MFS/spermidine synthase [Methylovulum sp.]
MNAAPDRRLSLILLFAVTLFTSASLMFVLQPLFGKLLLPLLGGSPAVWNTCMVFYQSILFLGYLYAHTLSTRFNAAQQIAIHAGIILLSVLALPVGLPETISPPTESDPTFWLLSTLGLAIGLPFFVLSTTAPLIQKWFAQIGHHASHDPYFLYAASNTGSLLALLSYPFVLEPNIGLAAQQTDWSVGYAVLGVLIASCALVLWKNHPPAAQTDKESTDKIPYTTQLHWLALALVPSSLLLGLTNFISTDIASVPLLWVIPLTVYLLSFIIVFSKWNDAIHPWMVRIQPVFLVPFIAYAFINPADLPYWMYLILHVIAFFFAIMVCHGELAKLRPNTQHLTRYYLIMSFAGMLGGMFNTFVAPFIFNGIYEYPIMIIAALLLRPGLTINKRALWQLLPPALLVAIGLVLYFSVSNLLDYFDAIAISLMVLTLVIFFFRKQPALFALSAGAIIFLALGVHSLSSRTLFQDRTFFGVLAVRESTLTDEQGQPETYRELFHGTTKHGAQRLAANLSTIPLTYYSRPGPMGQLFKTYDDVDQNWRIGSVGLGAGALACYSKPGQQWTLYEIDPLVVDIASDPRWFTYLSHCNKTALVSIGDARLSLAKEPDHSFDLLVMDAFSSDAVPTHLLTEEAMKLYFQKLKPGGILAFHITNRHLSLKKVLSIHAENLHLAALIEEFIPQEEQPLVVATDWVVLANQAKTLEPLKTSLLGDWQKMPLYFDMKPWTDDFTNIVGIWK